MLAVPCILIIVCSLSCTWAASVPQHEPLFHPDLRIHGGGDATAHEYPPAVWMQIFSKNPKNNKTITSQCGGSLISKNYVLTAAHCLQTTFTKKKHDIVLGLHDWVKDTGNDHQTFEVTKADFKIHPSYNPGKAHFADIGLIKLPSSATIKSKVVETAKLPRKADASKSYVGQLAKAYGWGPKTEKSKVSDVLRYYQSEVLSTTECAKGITMNTDNICTKGTDRSNKTVGVCGGDSGGPLIDPNGVQIGVVSRSRDCDAGYPSVFINIGTYLTWIEQNSDAVIN